MPQDAISPHAAGRRLAEHGQARPQAPGDGRSARRDRNRTAVLDAVLELFAAGDLSPSPESVARRSGLSLRSVYRYVSDGEGLILAAIDRHLEKVRPLYVIDRIGEGTFAERVESFVSARLRLYLAVAPTARAAALRAQTNQIIAGLLDDRRHVLRAQLKRHFAAEIARLPGGAQAPAMPGLADPAGLPPAAAAADALTQIETLDWFATRGGYHPGQIRQALVAALTSLLGPAGGPPRAAPQDRPAGSA